MKAKGGKIRRPARSPIPAPTMGLDETEHKKRVEIAVEKQYEGRKPWTREELRQVESSQIALLFRCIREKPWKG